MESISFWTLALELKYLNYQSQAPGKVEDVGILHSANCLSIRCFGSMHAYFSNIDGSQTPPSGIIVLNLKKGSQVFLNKSIHGLSRLLPADM